MGLHLVRDILPLYVLVFRGVESTCPLEVVLVFVVRGGRGVRSLVVGGFGEVEGGIGWGWGGVGGLWLLRRVKFRIAESLF